MLGKIMGCSCLYFEVVWQKNVWMQICQGVGFSELIL